MAKTLVPTSWLTGYSCNGTTLSIPLTTLTGLTAGEANASTGDIRKILYALLNLYYTATIAKPAADRLGRCTVNKVSTTTLDGRTDDFFFEVRVQAAATTLPAEP